MTQSRKPTKFSLSPTQIIFIGFIAVIFVGGFLLFLPISQNPSQPSISFVDALFTATSATCVTGLVVVTTALHWSTFGKIVIMLLIQIGGLSFISFYAYFLFFMGKRIRLEDRMLLQTSFNYDSFQGVIKLLILIVRGTLILEGVAAFFLFIFFKFKEQLSFATSLFYSVFHAISSFCNAGFDILGETSLSPYVGNYYINFIVISLIVSGGIGFVVWQELLDKIKGIAKRDKNRASKRLSIHTRFAIIGTLTMILFGMIFTLLNEGANPETIGNLPLPHKMLASLFYSVTLRTAGYYSFNPGALKDSTKIVSGLIMAVGGSPGGTAGGIKTVTIAVILASVYSTLKGQSQIVVWGRTLSYKILQKSITIAVLMLSLLFVGTGILSVLEKNCVFPHTFVDIFYEVASALNTVGITSGITPYLSVAGKILIMSCMLIGRLGPTTVYIALTSSHLKSDKTIKYPEENVLIG